MNKTEEKAYEYLLKYRDYSEKDIVFQHNITPDFITSDGRGYEVKQVKRVCNSSFILINPSQIDKLKSMEDAEILAFNDGEDIPIIFTTDMLFENNIIGGIKIVLAGRSVTIREDVYKKLDSLKTKANRSFSDVMDDLVEEKNRLTDKIKRLIDENNILREEKNKLTDDNNRLVYENKSLIEENERLTKEIEEKGRGFLGIIGRNK